MSAVHDNANGVFNHAISAETQSCLSSGPQSSSQGQPGTENCQESTAKECATCTQANYNVPKHVISAQPELDIFTNIAPSELEDPDLAPVTRPPEKFL